MIWRMIVMKFTFISNKEMRKRSMAHRAMGIFLSAAMVFNMLPMSGSAVYALEKKVDGTNASPVSVMPAPTISQEGGTFAGDTLTLTIGIQNATSGTYKIGDAVAETYTSEKIITIGSDMEVGETIKITLSATDGNETNSKEYTFTKVLAAAKVEKEGKVIAYVETENLQDVFKEINSGATITLLKDINLEKRIYIYSTDQQTNFTLDLNGKTVKGKGAVLHMLGRNVTLTIVDNSNDKNGTLYGRDFTGQGAGTGMYVSRGTVYLKGGTFSGDSFGVDMDGGTLYVHEGAVIAGVGSIGIGLHSSSFGSSNNNESKIFLSGGSISGKQFAIYTEKTLKDLLDTSQNEKGKYYAFFNGEVALTEGLDEHASFGIKSLTVGECTNHSYSITNHANGTTNHNRTCRACGYEDNEKCSFGKDGKCVCGATLTVTLNNATGLVYDGSEQKPDVTVTADGEILNNENYSVTYTNNKNVGTATVTIEGKTYDGTVQKTFEIAKATPDIGTVTADDMENTFDVSKVVLKREKQTPAGTLKLADGSILQYGTNTYTWEFTPDDTVNYVPTTGTVEITVKDTINPSASYQIGTDGWKKFVDTISFGLFCKDYKTVEIEFTDDTDTVKGSGVAQKQYYISDKEITNTNDIEWKDYAGTINLNAKGTYFIYVKVSDKAGNTVILNSEGIVIYEESVLNSAGFDYTYKQNKDCVVELDMKGNTLQKLADNKESEMTPENDYTIENGKLTLKAAYLDTLDKGEYIYKIYMNPQGVETDKVTLVYTFTVNVKAKELTVSGVTATDREYNKTNTVDITEVALNGIAAQDDVAVDLTGIQGTLSSANAGEYDAVTLPKLTLKGTDKGNYTLVQPTGSVTTSVTIEKAAAEITVGTDTYNKTFGDGAFHLDAAGNNPEKEVQYTVATGEDVVCIENGTVNVKKPGTATITVSLPASANYKVAGDKTIAVNVAKKSGYVVEDINKSYLYTEDSADTMELAAILPKDCGTITYKAPETSGNVTFNVLPAVNEDILSYTVGNGSKDATGNISIVAETQNYEDITITVNVKLTDKIPVRLKDNMKVTLKNDTLNYGEALSTLEFNETEFVDSDGNNVEGTLKWKSEEAKPKAGTTNAIWVFLPNDDTKYATLEGGAIITVNKAVPVIDAVPTVSDQVYNPSVMLKDISLSGGTVSVGGSWSWERASIVPNVNNSGYVAVFTPTDTTNYETVTETVTVKVTKATPYIKTAPSAAVITYGDTLSVSNLAGGEVQYSNDSMVSGYDTAISGSFTWKDASQKPVVAGGKAYTVVFSPADGENYNSVETTVLPTVQKAENAPNMPSSTMNVSNSCKKVSDVTLPDGWEWQAADKSTELEAGTAIDAVAIYTGADKGNYERETVTIALTRSSCDHVTGDILYTQEGEKAPTCTENGLGHRECTKCHSLIESGIVVTATGHLHIEIRGAVGATCTTGGYTGDSYCRDCGVKIANGTVTGKSGHNYTSQITKNPTTEEEGVRTYTCVGCGNSYTEAISKLPKEEHKHTYTSIITKEPTCKETGVITYSCSCGDSYTQSIPALNHNYTSTITKEPTTKEEGVRTYTCTRCGDSYTEAISRLPEEEHKHTYISVRTKEPTCKETGVITYSCACGDSYTESIPVLIHSYTKWKSDETNHWHECSNCGDKKDVAAHSEDNGTVTKEATETETGIKTYKCSVCQRELRTEIIDKLSHTHAYGSDWKSDGKNHWHECSCGEKSEESSHNFGAWTVVKEATEEKEGTRERACMICGYKQTEKIPKEKPDQKDDKEKQEKNKLSLDAGLKVSQTGSQINIAWGKVSGASGYDVYVQYCGMKFNAKSVNQVKGGTKTKTIVKKVNKKKLDLKKSYKVYVAAYKISDGKKVILCKSITAHIIGRNNKKYTNVKAITIKKNSYTLKKGKTTEIQAKTVLVNKNRKELSNNHAEKFRYASSNKKIATVSANGKIKAIKKGSCIIYVYAKNGYAKKIKVTVK